MADDVDGEEEALVMWVVNDGNSEGNKKYGTDKTKKTKVDPKFGDIQLHLSQIFLQVTINQNCVCIYIQH